MLHHLLSLKVYVLLFKQKKDINNFYIVVHLEYEEVYHLLDMLSKALQLGQ